MKRSSLLSALVALPLLAFGCDEATETPEPESVETAEAIPEPEVAPEAAPEPAQPEAAEPAEPANATLATIGQPAPAFELRDQAGVTHRLADYRGKIVVLEWTNPQCPFVQRHYQADTMTGLVSNFEGRDVVWLAIDSSNFVQPADSAAWRTEEGMTYPVLQDPSGQVGHQYNARTTPHMFVIDAEGVLRYEGAIDDDPRDRNDTDVNYVQSAVDALLGGNAPEVTQSEPYGCTVKYENS